MAQTAPEARQGAGHVGEADGQAIDLLHHRIDHAHGEHPGQQRQRAQGQTGRQRQQQGQQAEQQAGALAGQPLQQHAAGIAQHEGADGQRQVPRRSPAASRNIGS